jgi:hypothetical protein
MPRPEASTSLLNPPMKFEATGHACAAPPTSSEQFLARWISFLRAPHGPSLLIAPPPPRWAPRLPSTPERSTPHQRVPAGTTRQGGAQGKLRYRTVTQCHCHHCHRPPPPRPSQRGFPPQGDPQAFAGDDVLATPRARGSSCYAAFSRHLFSSSPRPQRGVSPDEPRDPLRPVAMSL